MADGVTTLADLARNAPRWVWLYCEGRECYHSAAAPLAPFIIRWGPDASSDLLRRSVRCVCCGHRGCSIYNPSWQDTQIGWQPFPSDRGIVHASPPV